MAKDITNFLPSEKGDIGSLVITLIPETRCVVHGTVVRRGLYQAFRAELGVASLEAMLKFVTDQLNALPERP